MKPLVLTSLFDLAALEADTIIDVRSPSEFAEDHLPGAINLPVLSDAERARVGTIYVQDAPFTARKIGAALVARNTAAHLDGPLADKTGDWRPLVYCWRGGQRSGSFATILDQVGWRVSLLRGGYQSYRRLVVKALYDTPLEHRLVLIAGGTGTAKTRLLYELQDAGAQMLDLEGLANHRGSLFGAMAGDQPSQKMFESRVAAALSRLNPAQITFVEAESSKVGARLIPPALWSAMQTAPRITISAPAPARAAFLCRTYADLTENPATLTALIEQLRPYHPRDRIAEWQALAAAGDWPALAQGLITEHYDPRYTKSAPAPGGSLRVYALPDLAASTLTKTAARIISDVTATSPDLIRHASVQ